MKVFTTILFSLFLQAFVIAFDCIHDKIDHHLVIKEESQDVIDMHNRALQSAVYASIRINASYYGIITL